MASPSKILSLEALRGYMCLWVVASHLLQMSGDRLNTGLWATLANAQFAVQTFMILSGYVIALVISRRPEPYRHFITRRFFRIYPAFFLASCAGIALHGVYGALIHQPWSSFFSPDTLHYVTSNWLAYNANIPGYAAAVLTMTNGVIPDNLMPHVAVAFIGVVWSLSLEFQFYLISPLLCKRMMPSRSGLLQFLGLLILFVTLRQPLFGFINNAGFPLSNYIAFLPNSIEFFVVGILSFHLHQWCLHNQQALRSLLGENRVSLLLVTLILFLLVTGNQNRLLLKGNLLEITGHWTGFLIWLLMLAWLVDGDLGTRGRLHRVGDFLLNSKLPIFLGSISYSIYLWHVPVILSVQWGLNRFHLISSWQYCLLYTTLTAIPLTLLISWISYRWIELPFIKIGSRIIDQPQ
ncbi:MAG: acyltransferase [Verrucomicrobiota bacterium]